MKLTLRIPTALGPRIVIAQSLASEDAHAIADAVSACEGWAASVDQDAPRVSLAAHLKKIQRANDKPKLVAVRAPNVTALPARKRVPK